MSPGDKAQTIELVARLWPKAYWPKEVQVEFGRRLDAIQIGFDQAHAALVNLRMGTKFAAIQPKEVWDALRSASGVSPGQALPGAAMSGAAQTWRDFLARSDREHWYKPLAARFIHEHEPRAMHWLDMTDSLLDTRDSLRGGLARRFCEWVAGRAESTGWAIGMDGQAVRSPFVEKT